MTKSNRQQLRLSQKNFEYIPRELLQFLNKWGKQFVDGKNNQNIVSVEVTGNKLQQIEDSLFNHLGPEGCKNLEQIKADSNQLSFISAKLRDCIHLQNLNLSNNQLAGDSFLPVDMPQGHSFAATLQYLYLSNNQIRDLPLSLGKLESLKVLDLEHNKIRTLLTKHNGQQVSVLSTLVNLEELYLN